MYYKSMFAENNIYESIKVQILHFPLAKVQILH